MLGLLLSQVSAKGRLLQGLDWSQAVFLLKDFNLKTKEQHAEAIAFRNGVALPANVNATFQGKKRSAV